MSRQVAVFRDILRGQAYNGFAAGRTNGFDSGFEFRLFRDTAPRVQGQELTMTNQKIVFATLDEVLAFSGKIDDATSAISAFLTRPGATIEEARKVVDFVNFRRSVEG